MTTDLSSVTSDQPSELNSPLRSLVVDRASLKDALEVVNLTTTKEVGAVTSVILFQVHPKLGRVDLKSSNRRAFTSAPLALKSAVGTADHSFTVDAKSLLQWLGAVDADSVEVSDIQPDAVRFQCGKMSAYMRGLDPSTFPDQSEVLAKASEKLVSCTAEQLASGFSFVKPFLAQPGAAASTKEALQLAHWNKNQVIGSDTKIMGIYRSLVLQDADLKVAFQEVGGLVSFLRKYAAEPVEVVRNNQILFAVTGSGAYYGFAEPMIQPLTFPPIDVKPDSEPVVISLPPSEVARAIKAVSATAEPRDVYLALELRPIEQALTVEPAPFLDDESAAAARAAQADLDKEKAAGQPTHELLFRMRDSSERHDNEASVPVHVQRGDGVMSTVHFNFELLVSILAQFSTDGVLLCFNAARSYLKVYDHDEDHERCAFLTMLKAPASRS